jgi:curved DNA-binding protein CbpA
MSQPIEWHGITHMVVGERAAVALFERVLVDPQPIRAANLLINEAKRRLPEIDARAPAQWNAAHAEAIINQRAGPHLNRRRRDNFEMEPRRGDHVEIRSVGEKRKYVFRRQPQPQFGLKFMDSHRLTPFKLVDKRAHVTGQHGGTGRHRVYVEDTITMSAKCLMKTAVVQMAWILRVPIHSLRLHRLQHAQPNHYATLGLDPRCTAAQIRAAYRVLAKQFHPDVNQGCTDALSRTQQLNAAYEVLSDPECRLAYDQARANTKQRTSFARTSKTERNISQDVHLRIPEFLRGTTLEVRVNDPANPDGPETFELVVPPETPPGSRFRLPRSGVFEGGFVLVRVKARPDFRFKTRGSDLRCDLQISSRRATQGGEETVNSATGARLRVRISAGVTRGEIVRIAGEGLPRPKGGRGDLLVRILYRPEVRITRRTGR